MRATGRDDAMAIEKGLIASNFKAATKAASSSSYSDKETLAENKNLFTSDFNILEGPRERKKWFDSLVKERRNNLLGKGYVKESFSDHEVDMFPNNVDNGDDNVKKLMDFVGKKQQGLS